MVTTGNFFAAFCLLTGGFLEQSGPSGLEPPSIRANRVQLGTRFSIRSKAIFKKPFKPPHLSLGCYERARSRVRAAFPVDQSPLRTELPLSCSLQHRPFGQLVHFHVAPQRNQQLARQSDNSNLAYPATALGETFQVPAAQLAFGLKPQPVPRRLHRIRPHITDPRLTDPLFPTARPALVGARHQPAQRGKLAAVFNLSPAKKLHRVKPRTVHSDPSKPHQLAHGLKVFLLRVLDSQLLLRHQFLDLATDQFQPLVLALQTLDQSRGQSRPIPQLYPLQRFEKIFPATPKPNALAEQKPLDAVALSGAFLFQPQKLAVQLLSVLGLYARYMHHAPQLVFPQAVPNQHPQQLLYIEPIGLGTTSPAIHLNTGGIHDVVLNSQREQKSVQPKTITPCFITAHHFCLATQTKTLLGSLDLLSQPDSVATPDPYLPRFLPQPRARSHSPSRLAQLQGHVENVLLFCANVFLAGRCCFHFAPSPFFADWIFQELNSNDLLFCKRHSISPAKRARVKKRPILGALRIEKPPRPFRWERAGVREISFYAGERKIIKSLRGLLVFVFVIFTSGCLVGPDYRSPQIDTPQTWRV